MPETGNKRSGADWTAVMPKQIVPAANLLTPQLGAAAAVSALGLGFASQMWGFWAGAVAGVLDANTTFKPLTKAESTPLPQLAPDVDALKTIIRKKASDISPKVVELPVAEAQLPVTVKEPAQPAKIETAKTPDDLKRISGVGPKLEQVLNGMGIRTYAQIAAWTLEDIARVDDQLQFGGRIGRDDWVGQASALAPRSKD